MSTFHIALGPRIRQSPYFEETVAAGATTFTVYNHMYMPVSYGDPEGEYWRLVEGVSMWDVAAQRQIEISGPDARTLIDLLAARSVADAPVGRARYTPICDHEGRLLNDPVVLRTGEHRWWVSIADNDMGPLWRGIAGERGLDVAVDEVDVAPLAVQGPKAEAVAVDLLGEWVGDLAFFGYRPHLLDEIPLWVGRGGWSKQGGFELYLCDSRFGPELWKRVALAGRRHGIGPGAPNPVERLESGLLSFRTDHELDCDPFEVGLGRWVDLDRPVDFIGKAALRRRLTGGPRRRLVGAFIDGSPTLLNTRPWPVWSADSPAGQLRAVAHSLRLDRTIGLALVDEGFARPGTALTVEPEVGSPCRATVTTLPFL